MTLPSTLVKSSIFLAVLCLGASALMANAQVSVNVHVGIKPPAQRYEHAPHPRRGYLWAPGYWGWDGRAHVWFGGHWEAERPGFRFIEARWVLVGGEWMFYPSYWDALPAAVVVQQPAPTYIEQPQYAPAPQSGLSQAPSDPNFWYYCRNPSGYYPYVRECAGAWQKVTPTPPPRND